METNETPKPTSIFQSNTAKMIMVGLLTLFLLVPLEYVKNLISERSYRQNDVISEINDKWGESVYIYGPILKIPYTSYEETVTINEKTKETVKQKVASTKYAYFFPQELNINSNIDTKILNRNNYESAVFTTNMKFKGNYIRPDFSSKNIAPEAIQWDKATILIKTTNLKSIKEEVKIIKVNVDQHQDLASEFMVRGVPTLMLFRDGKMLWRQSGVLATNDLVGIIRQHLN